MSTDIELFAEKFMGDTWHPVPEPKKDRPKGRSSKRIFPTHSLDIGQPYELFSLLSGQRIGMSAGLVELPRLFGGRGFPKDLSPYYRASLPKFYEKYGDDKGPSWLELRELIELDWDLPLLHHGYVEARYAGYFHPEKSFPKWFPKGGELYHGLICPLPVGATRVEWSLPLREFVGCGEWFIEQLLALSTGAELRIIYWFS